MGKYKRDYLNDLILMLLVIPCLREENVLLVWIMQQIISAT